MQEICLQVRRFSISLFPNQNIYFSFFLQNLGSDPSVLLPRHSRFVLDLLKCGHEYWNALSPERHVFETLLLRVIASKTSIEADEDDDEDVDVIADLIDDAVPIIVVNMNPEKDLELRQHLFGLLIQLFTNAGKNIRFKTSPQLRAQTETNRQSNRQTNRLTHTHTHSQTDR